MAMLPGASTSTETIYVKFLPGGDYEPASLLTSTHRIMTAISTPPPRGAHVYWDTVAWKKEIRVTTAPNYGTLTECIWWTVVEREVHRGSGFPIAGLQKLNAFPSDQMQPTTWGQTVYAKAGGEYGDWKMPERKEGWKVPSDDVIDEWLIRRVTRMRVGRTMIPQCREKHKKKVVLVVKRKRVTVRFVKKETSLAEKSRSENRP
ncbi:hypothetical protein B0T20DRAFT_407263 [Sordaria brevicollis]|uniref:Uncharacterized protein n=1 Tax=Sordaria brevicollis TaxID=83679 RepID=A0AAE0UD89_SORBR|nr:hypothetical protein B0T20DRAFT_407263 [Sordaria brevicollis]